VGLADAGRPEQQHGCHFEAVAAVLRQRHMPLHIIERINEVGQLLVQRRHVGNTAGLDLEAFGPTLEHAFVRRAQVLVIAVRQLGQLALDVVRAEHAADIGDGQLERRRLMRNETACFHRRLLGEGLRVHSSISRARVQPMPRGPRNDVSNFPTYR
jgi:hypothetical protein